MGESGKRRDLFIWASERERSDARIDKTVIYGTVYGNSWIGRNTYVAPTVIVGHPGKSERHLLVDGRLDEVAGAAIRDDCIIRDYGVIYSGASIGNGCQTGHHFVCSPESISHPTKDYIHLGMDCAPVGGQLYFNALIR